jgi:hypothetical protein
MMTHAVTLPLTVETRDGPRPLIATIESTVIAGWTGRDKAAMEHHMAELEAIGIKRPASTPVYYRIGCTRLTSHHEIEASGEDSSGEVEAVLIQSGGETYVGLGSDHTDRKVEAYGITVSKQMCDKPIGGAVWLFAEVAPHWDELKLRSYAEGPGPKRLYQEGKLSAMLPVAELIKGFTKGAGQLPEGTLMFCGTLPAIGGIKPARAFTLELEDPVLQRTLRHVYRVLPLPIAG